MRAATAIIRSLRAARAGALPAVLLAVCLTLAGGSMAAEPDWTDYDAVLARHVGAGSKAGIALHQVDYEALARDAQFAHALAAVETFDPARLQSPAETLAFLINAYNLFALRLVTDHLPLASIRDIGNFLRPVWKRRAGRLGGVEVSLDEVEHARLRTLGEPRIHFAIVCASISCPDLRTEAYRAARLDAQLDEQVLRFLDNPGKGLRRDGSRAHVSKIFDWFADDFAADGGVAGFIARHHPLPAGTAIKADLDYDWRLNGR